MRGAYALPVEKRLWFSMEDISLPEESAVNCSSFPELLKQIPEV